MAAGFVYSNPEPALFGWRHQHQQPYKLYAQGREEVVMIVAVEDGAEMRGGNGRVEGRSEMLLPQNSGLIISPL